MKVLADTGAECNLIKKGFVPHHLTNVAREKVNLLAVNGQVLQGGNRKTTVTLRFEKQINGKKAPELAQYKIDFYEADIEVDGILSYAWMAKEKLGVFPHLRAMALDLPVTTLIYGKGGNPGKPTGPTRLIGQDQEICTVPVHQDRVDRRPYMRRKEGAIYNQFTEEELMEVMEGDNSWEGDPDELDLEAEIEAMNLRVPPTG
jgi:hypothetical protein